MNSLFCGSFIKSSLSLVSILALSSAFAAENKVYELTNNSDGKTGVEFKIGYTLGTHKGVAQKAKGTVELVQDVNSFTLVSTEVSVPISSIQTGADLRDCHLRESLGLDYSVSNYPKQHVCQNNDLPTSGIDAIVYPNITFSLENFQISSSQAKLEAGKTVTGKATGKWTIHGVSKEKTLDLNLTLLADGKVQVAGKIDFSLVEFDVTVIPWAGLIKVKDTASVDLNLVFAPKL